MSLAKCDYAVELIHDLLVLVDLNLGNKSLTNDIENVLADLNNDIDLFDKVIVYRDSDGHYDRVLIRRYNRFDIFLPISEKRQVNDLFDVIKILKQQEHIE